MLRKSISAVFVAVMLLCMFAACAQEKEDVYQEIPAVASSEAMRNTVLYYEDDYGFVVPVMKEIKWVEGIGAEAVSELKANPDADSEMETMGLNAILSEDAKISLSIKTGLATLKLSKGAITGTDAVDEMCKVQAVVNTLTEFSSISKVRIVQEGADETLAKGTDISQPFARFDLNVVTVLSEDDLKNASKVMLYFQDESGEAIVPVTKYIGGKADPFAVMSELVKGPGCHGLMNLMPDDTKLLGIDVDKNGVASINFSKEFSGIGKEPDKEARLLKCIVFSLKQFDNIKDVRILVNGNEYKSASQTTMSSNYINTMD
jgi:germination protein M